MLHLLISLCTSTVLTSAGSGLSGAGEDVDGAEQHSEPTSVGSTQIEKISSRDNDLLVTMVDSLVTYQDC